MKIEADENSSFTLCFMAAAAVAIFILVTMRSCVYNENQFQLDKQRVEAEECRKLMESTTISDDVKKAFVIKGLCK